MAKQTNLFVHFLEESSAWNNHYSFVWPKNKLSWMWPFYFLQQRLGHENFSKTVYIVWHRLECECNFCWGSSKKFSNLKIQNEAQEPAIPPVDLYLISEKSIWKNQDQQTGFLVYFKLNFYCLCSLQKSISKLIFAGWKSSSSNLIFLSWLFKKSSTGC